MEVKYELKALAMILRSVKYVSTYVVDNELRFHGTLVFSSQLIDDLPSFLTVTFMFSNLVTIVP